MIERGGRMGQATCNWVVAASGSQPREGWLLIEETSLIELCRARVFGPLTSTSAGWQVCYPGEGRWSPSAPLTDPGVQFSSTRCGAAYLVL